FTLLPLRLGVPAPLRFLLPSATTPERGDEKAGGNCRPIPSLPSFPFAPLAASRAPGPDAEEGLAPSRKEREDPDQTLFTLLPLRLVSWCSPRGRPTRRGA